LILREKIRILLAIGCAFLTYLAISDTNNAFNYLPFLLHESFDPGGSSESVFIRIFDIIVSISVGWGVFTLLKSFNGKE
jgi:hypothetical protein